jgi:gluconolactonase
VAWLWELLDGPDSITEGPAWDGEGLFYTAIAHNEIRRYDPQTNRISTVYRDSGAANGLLLAPDGRLLACEGGGRAIASYDRSGRKSILIDRFEGRRLNSPNDLALDSKGRIWFTDPRYGDDHSDRELNHDSVYRITKEETGSWSIERMTFDMTRPNGILISPDERTLYVAQSDYVPTAKRDFRAYPILDDGTLGPHTVLHDFGDHRGIDGMCFDATGHIVATCGWELGGPGCRIAIFASDGRVVEEHPLPDGRPTNCVFGGPQLNDLYVTSITGHLYRVSGSGRTGQLPPPLERPFAG